MEYDEYNECESLRAEWRWVMGQVVGRGGRAGGPAGAEVTQEGAAPPSWAPLCNVTALSS